MHSVINKEGFAEFEKFARDYCEQRGKKIRIIKRKNILLDGARYGGWCDGEELVVASKNNLFEEIFIHEFAHMTQAVKNVKVWRENGDIWTGLQSSKISVADWPEFMKTIAVERDCEQRSVKFIKEFDILSPEEYSKKANMYLFYYQYVFLTKKWHNSTSIYSCDSVYEKMPDKILSLQSFNKINMPIMEKFHRHFSKKV
jgi:hypothetical protein